MPPTPPSPAPPLPIAADLRAIVAYVRDNDNDLQDAAVPTWGRHCQPTGRRQPVGRPAGRPAKSPLQSPLNCRQAHCTERRPSQSPTRDLSHLTSPQPSSLRPMSTSLGVCPYPSFYDVICWLGGMKSVTAGLFMVTKLKLVCY
jgi:hypothetical protein